jgi:hypothetical protein
MPTYEWQESLNIHSREEYQSDAYSLRVVEKLCQLTGVLRVGRILHPQVSIIFFSLLRSEYTRESAIGDSLNLQITISSEYLKNSESLNHQIAGISKTSMVS